MYLVCMRSLVLAITLALLVFPNLTHSKTDEEETGTYTLGEIVVTGKRPYGVESVGTVREITEEDIRMKNARTLDEALELLPGLDIRTATDGVPRVNLRGFRSRHVLLLLDGIPLNSTFDGQFDPSIISVENIAKIKISYGNHSVLYGQGGLAGVINVITKKGEKGFRGTVEGEVGERDHYQGKFSFSGGRDKYDFFMSGSASQTDGYPLSEDFEATALEGGGLRENSDKERNNFFANVGFAPSGSSTVGLVFNYLKGEYGKPPSTLSKSDDPLFAKNPKYVRVEDYEGLSSQISISSDLPGPMDMRGWFFINQSEEEENRYDDENYDTITKKGSYSQDTRTRIYGGTLQPELDLQAVGRFILGLSFERHWFESKGEIVKKKKTPPEQFGDDWYVKVYSASIEYEMFKSNPFGVVLGFGHSWFEKQRGESENDGHFLLGAHYDIWQDLRVIGSIARKIRFPSIRQLYEEGSGNPDLTAERSYNYELGIQLKVPGNTSLALTLFRIDAADYIEKIPPTDQFLNNDKYRFQGFELTAETHCFRNLLLRAGYSFLHTRDRSSEWDRKELQYRPEHKFTFDGKYTFNNGFSVYMNFMYVADQYDYSDTVTPLKRELNDYALFNVKLEQSLFNSRLHLYLGADNLFDEDYEEAFGFPQSGQEVYGGMKFRF